MEIRKAPNDTAALSFVANSEAARYVFVVVVVHDVMIAGRRYDTFVLACGGLAPPQHRRDAASEPTNGKNKRCRRRKSHT